MEKIIEILEDAIEDTEFDLTGWASQEEGAEVAKLQLIRLCSAIGLLKSVNSEIILNNVSTLGGALKS